MSQTGFCTLLGIDPPNVQAPIGSTSGPAVFPASDAASCVTGQVLHVDGGYTAQ